MKPTTPTYKFVKLRTDSQWTPLNELAEELAKDLNVRISMADAITHAVKFTRANRKKVKK